MGLRLQLVDTPPNQKSADGLLGILNDGYRGDRIIHDDL